MYKKNLLFFRACILFELNLKSVRNYLVQVYAENVTVKITIKKKTDKSLVKNLSGKACNL